MSFQIFITTLKGTNITLDVDSNDTIQHIKQKINDKDNFPIEHQILTYSGKILLSHHSITHYGISQYSTLHLSLKLLSSHVKLQICEENPSTTHSIPITSLTTLAEFKAKCIAEKIIQSNTKIVINNHILTNDNICMMDIKNWNKEIFHTKSRTTLDDIKHIRFSIYSYPFKTKMKSNAKKLGDKTTSINTLIYDYLESINVNPLFHSRFPQCPFQYVSIHANGAMQKVGLMRKKKYKGFGVKIHTYVPFDGKLCGHGIIPSLPLNVCCDFSKYSNCDCGFQKAPGGWDNELEVEIGFPNISFLFRNHYYINGKFYKVFSNAKNTFALHFCPTSVPTPLKSNEQLLVHGYVRDEFLQHYNRTSLDIINLIGIFYPQLLGCEYEVSKYNQGLCDKFEQKTKVFTIDNLKFYLEYVGNYDRFSNRYGRRKGYYLILCDFDGTFSDITLVCQLYCKTTKQRITSIGRGNLSNIIGESKHILLGDLGNFTSLESIVCKLTILNMVKSHQLYEYPLKITQCDYFMQWKIGKEILNSIKTSMAGKSNFQHFESNIFYDMFVLRCSVKKDTIYIDLRLVALPINKRNANGLLVKGRFYIKENNFTTQEFNYPLDYTTEHSMIGYNFSNVMKCIKQNELTISSKIKIIEPLSEN